MCADIGVGTDRVGGSVLVEAGCLDSQIFRPLCLSPFLTLDVSLCMHVACLLCMCVCVSACENVVGGILAEPRDEAAE